MRADTGINTPLLAPKNDFSRKCFDTSLFLLTLICLGEFTGAVVLGTTASRRFLWEMAKMGCELLPVTENPESMIVTTASDAGCSYNDNLYFFNCSGNSTTVCDTAAATVNHRLWWESLLMISIGGASVLAIFVAYAVMNRGKGEPKIQAVDESANNVVNTLRGR